MTAGADTPGHLLDALRFGHWAIVSTFAERAREWSPAQLAALYLDLASPGLAAARRWLLEHGLDAEARLAPMTDLPTNSNDAIAELTVVASSTEARDTTTTTATPGVLGCRLFDALLQQLPTSAEAVEDLLQAGASPAGAGLLALALSRSGNAADAAALPLHLLERGADPFGPDARERTPLHLAAVNAQTDLLQALLTRGCNPNTHDHDGRTPLFAALEHGAVALPLVRALIAYGANPEVADTNGETPLGRALEHRMHRAPLRCCVPAAAAMPRSPRACSMPGPIRHSPRTAVSPRWWLRSAHAKAHWSHCSWTATSRPISACPTPRPR